MEINHFDSLAGMKSVEDLFTVIKATGLIYDLDRSPLKGDDLFYQTHKMIFD